MNVRQKWKFHSHFIMLIGSNTFAPDSLPSYSPCVAKFFFWSQSQTGLPTLWVSLCASTVLESIVTYQRSAKSSRYAWIAGKTPWSRCLEYYYLQFVITTAHSCKQMLSCFNFCCFPCGMQYMQEEGNLAAKATYEKCVPAFFYRPEESDCMWAFSPLSIRSPYDDRRSE